jgi:hypothetical protein
VNTEKEKYEKVRKDVGVLQGTTWEQTFNKSKVAYRRQGALEQLNRVGILKMYVMKPAFQCHIFL